MTPSSTRGRSRLAERYVKRPLRVALTLLFEASTNLTLVLIIFLAPLRYVTKVFRRKQSLSIWAGTPIINMAVNAQAERLLGADARSLVFETYYITDAFDYNLAHWRQVRVIGAFAPLMALLWACLFADRLHFYCDRGLLPSRNPFTFDFRELYIYRLLRIPVFLWTYGADVRTTDITKNLGEPNCCTECANIGKACICDATKGSRNMQKLTKYSDAIFSMGDMIEYTPSSRNDLFFWPIDLHGQEADRYKPVYPDPHKEGPLRVVHAPNHRMFKGTHFLIEAVDSLKAEGYDIELVIVEKIPHEAALDTYRSADIIFDQCLVGFHGYFALEGMAMGKPVMCFMRKSDYLLYASECPMINTNVSTLRDDLRQLMENRQELTKIGVASREYIEKYFTLEAFSKRLERAYKELGVTV